MTNAAPILTAQDVTRHYMPGKTRIDVLCGVTLSVAPGEIVAITGASGAGKSTLLHILGGLDEPSSGEVHFRGERLSGMSSARRAALRARHVGFVFQAYYLLPELDLVDNVLLPALAASTLGVPTPAHRARAKDLLEKVGLGHRLDHKPGELSGGEQQRAAIARALMNDPELVLADEPTGNLDSKTGTHVLESLFALAGGGRHALVVVTHNEELARRCGRHLSLVDGRL